MSQPQDNRPVLLLCDGKLLEPVDHALFTGWQPLSAFRLITGQPKFRWKGKKIPFELWAKIVCFMRWSQAEIKEESMLFLFYHTVTGAWDAWVFPQNPSGMTVRMLPEHPLYAEDRKKFGDGWIQAGTVHHHCNAGAFQSSTDKTDEEDRDGFHVTLGKMELPSLDVHCRQVFDGIQTETKLVEWVEPPPWIASVPKEYHPEFTNHAFVTVQGVPFDEEWKKRVFKFMHQANVTAGNFVAGANVASASETKSTTTPAGPGTGTTLLTGRGAGSRYWSTEYFADKLKKVDAVLTRMNISARYAEKLFAKVYGVLTEEEIKTRNALREAFVKEGIIMIYIEELLADLAKAEEDVAIERAYSQGVMSLD